jgi:hypothetical protein
MKHPTLLYAWVGTPPYCGRSVLVFRLSYILTYIKLLKKLSVANKEDGYLKVICLAIL